MPTAIVVVLVAATTSDSSCPAFGIDVTVTVSDSYESF